MSVKKRLPVSHIKGKNPHNTLYINYITNKFKDKLLTQLTTDTFMPISFEILSMSKEKMYPIITFLYILSHNTY